VSREEFVYELKAGPPALGPIVPRTAPTTSTADLPVTAEAMQPPIETAVGFCI